MFHYLRRCHLMRYNFNIFRANMSSINQSVIVKCQEDRIVLSFCYINEEIKMNRQFMFNRSKNEDLGHLLEKMSTKIKTIFVKRNKKLKLDDVDFPVSLINTKDDKVVCSKIGEVEVNSRRRPVADDLEEKVEHDDKDVDPISTYMVDRVEDHILSIGGIDYKFDLNPPSVNNLKIPNSCMAGYPVYPNYETSYSDSCSFEWYKSDGIFNDEKHAKSCLRVIKWEKFSDEFYCLIPETDVGKVIKVIATPKYNTRVGESVEVESICHITEGPGKCPFHTRIENAKDHTPIGQFRVLSYNILAYIYSKTEAAKDHLFSSCPPHALEMDYRKPLLMTEIIGYNADLICLQEVDSRIFKNDLLPVLSRIGFNGTHVGKGEASAEGCSVFYRSSKFTEIESLHFSLKDEIQINPIFEDLRETLSQCSETFNSVCNRNTILQISVLESKESPSNIIIAATTHLYFKPISDDIRLIQGWTALCLVRHVRQLYINSHKDKNIGVVFAGDFNSCPENAIFRLFTSQYIDPDDPDWRSDPEHKLKGANLSHDLELSTAYIDPPYTNFTCKFFGVLDYIFYQSDQLSLVKTVPFPTHEEVTRDIAMPSIRFPSDHIALIADFSFKK